MVVAGRMNAVPALSFLETNGLVCNSPDTLVIHQQCENVGVLDCDGACFPEFWVGDGVCDSGTATYLGNPLNMNCVSANFEGGDCSN